MLPLSCKILHSHGSRFFPPHWLNHSYIRPPHRLLCHLRRLFMPQSHTAHFLSQNVSSQTSIIFAPSFPSVFCVFRRPTPRPLQIASLDEMPWTPSHPVPSPNVDLDIDVEQDNGLHVTHPTVLSNTTPTGTHSTELNKPLSISRNLSPEHATHGLLSASPVRNCFTFRYIF
ncbi:hypothetical protein BC826DRAFT_1051103 [Russula brevipes]